MMKGSMSTDLGIITINPDVIAKYAGSMWQCRVLWHSRNGSS